MESKLAAMATVLGALELEVVRLDGSTERVSVKQMPIKDYPRILELVDDELGLAALYCGKDKAWAEGLTPASYEAVIENADKLNADFFSRWVARRLGRMERIKPGITERLMASAGAPGRSSSGNSRPQ